MNKNTTTIVIVLIILAIGAWLVFRNKPATTDAPISDSYTTDTGMGIGTGDAAKDAPGSDTPTVDVGVDTGVTVGATKSFTVTGTSNMRFDPSTLSVKKGDTVKITFKDAGGTNDFHIDAFNVATKMLKSGESETVQFVADKTGPFEYYCSFGNHRAMGMKGTLTVTL